MKDILYSVATDKTGKFIKASEAVKGESFFCIGCDREMIYGYYCSRCDC